MSNIFTSYIRIIKRDGKDLTTEEIEMLFNLSVRAYHTFGSYWVRIQKKYRIDEKCLDIQYGSGKTYGDSFLECYEVFDKYYVWERVADEGGSHDTIFTLNDSGEWVGETDRSACIYKFNKVKIKTNNLSPYFLMYNPLKISDDVFEIQMEGKYYACNNKAFFEVTEDNMNCYGPCLQYDEKYETDFDVLCGGGYVTKSETQFITDVFVHPHKELNTNEHVELFWNDRIVQSVTRIGNEIICKSADYWDNCSISDYMESIKREKL